MSDMRQKLLPVFLEEAGRKILQLDGFLNAGTGRERTLDDLEAAFRAAHTLKGTAALVRADAVSALSARIEGLLEGHFEKGRFPAQSEYEAMSLALEHLKTLVKAVAEGQPEPAGLLARAELALKLALSLPGRRPLGELHLPHDPFAEDAEFDAAPELKLSAPTVPLADPFAEDPSVENLSDGAAAPGKDPFLVAPSPEPDDKSALNRSMIDDPFADDPPVEPAGVAKLTSGPSAPAAAVIELEDPFADDPALDTSASQIRTKGRAAVDSSAASSGQPQDLSPSPVEAVSATPRQESYAERMRKRLAKESAIGTAQRIASTLMNQRESGVAERKFSCCCFRVADKDYHLPIANMIEVADLPMIVRLPLAPPIVRGLVNLRGKVLPVIDLGVQAGRSTQHVAMRKLVVAESGGEQLAFLTDGIPDLSEIMRGEKIDVERFIKQFRAGAT